MHWIVNKLRKIGVWIVLCVCGIASAQHCTLPAFPGTVTVCHTAYSALYDVKLQDPRLVVYTLTGPHTLGCAPRASRFHAEGDSAKPSQYSDSGFDLGHMSPAQDNAWDESVSKDSFSMINVAPQLPGLNRQEWERLEEDVRAWALQRGKLVVYVGPIIAAHDKKINGVDVPSGFFKVITDEKTGETLSFEMPQQAIAKGDVAPYLVSAQQVNRDTGLKIPGQAFASKTVWPADLAAWHAAHKAACGKE